VGKLVAAFIMFLAASALAIHESKPPPPPPPESATPVPHVDEAPPSRAIHDAVPPWVKYAAPPTPPVVAEPPPRRVIVIDDGEISVSSGDIPDAVDKCPDQPSGEDIDDGCPEPEALEQRAIFID